MQCEVGVKAILFGVLCAVSIGLSTKTAQAQVTVANVDFPSQVDFLDRSLALDGAGLLRWKGIFKVYAAAHYRENPDTPFQIDSDETHRLDLAYLRSISAEGFVKATELAFEQSLPANESVQQWQDRLMPFLRAYQDVEAGDRYSLIVTDAQVELRLNEQSVFQSTDTAVGRRLLAVWLGDRSAAPALRDQLLAQVD